MYIDMIRTPAPPIEGGVWLNGDPLRLGDPPGRPVLLDFWDYASIPSLGGIPYVLRWHDKYEKLGVAFVGVQVPSFPFGAEEANVAAAVRRLGLPYPVVVDGEGTIRKAFNIQSVPSRYIVDKDGRLRFYQVGDEDYGNVELFLHQALREMEPSLDLPELLAPLRDSDRVGGFTLPCTPETRLVERIDEAGGGVAESAQGPSTLQEGYPILSGPWERTSHAAILCGEGGVGIRYRGAEAYLLASHGSGATLEVRLDGAPVGPEARGEDLHLGPGGETTVRVEEPRPYQVVGRKQVEAGILEIEGTAPGLSVYSFQFASRPAGLPS